MPTYCFITEDGERFDKVFSMSKAPPVGESLFLTATDDGQVKAYRDLEAEHRPARPTELRSGPGGWPFWSDGCGVHVDQAAELRKRLADKGVPTNVSDKDGRVEMRTPVHRKAVLKALDMHDKAAWY